MAEKRVSIYADGTLDARDITITFETEDEIRVCDYSGYGLHCQSGFRRSAPGYNNTIRPFLAALEPSTPVRWLGSGSTRDNAFRGDFSPPRVTRRWNGFTVADILQSLPLD